VRVFPKAYQTYLANGGVPIDVDALPPTSGGTPSGGGESPAPAAEPSVPPPANAAKFQAPKTGKGEVYRHIVAEERLTYGFMVRMAEVIRKVDWQGVELLRIETDTGHVLYEDPTTPISATMFKVLAEDYGL
jgi:hypothetical protein